ncbi:FeoB-associated Cys-rich membrane protein [Mangrovibacterium marinum]|uniref:Attachment p12 family protein n=1 Tax=Mangrovibacterium marinum TaxID=1639118 RepID=A0A2T5C250_9BACT|nr:FeoB-associated Cys-rich membrane protein [Mangrovibacterium marinum]PTN08746.1 attachment p12 family protein [Mangrovibacterium marinum]
MIQNIIALLIVAAVVVKVGYNIYKAITRKDKGLCGGCASCDFKRELKKKGKLHPVNPERLRAFQKDNIRFAGKA